MRLSSERFLRRGLVLAGIGAITLIASACASSGGAGEPSSGSPSTSATSTPTGTTSGTSASGSSSSTASPASDRCRADQLQLSVGQSQGAAGTTFTTFVVVNSAGTPCTLFGYPGVSYLDSSGAQVGAPATRTSSPQPATVTLRPGDAAHFVVGNSEVIPQTGCPAPVSAPTLRMYPPDDTGSLTVAAPADGFKVCNPSVGPMLAGATE